MASRYSSYCRTITNKFKCCDGKCREDSYVDAIGGPNGAFESVVGFATLERGYWSTFPGESMPEN
jgi:hypothetical protein